VAPEAASGPVGVQVPEPADEPAVDPRAVAALEAFRSGSAADPGRELGGLRGSGELPPALERLHEWAGDRWPALADRPGRFMVLVVVVAAVVVGGGLRWLTAEEASGPGPTPTLAFTTTTVTTSAPDTADGSAADGAAAGGAATAALVVHAAGAVHQPGVHRVPAGARVADVLTVAGGPTPEADLDRLNLAAPVADGQRLYVPRVGDPDVPPVLGPDAGSSGAGAPDGATGGSGGLVDLNRATSEQLDDLPGVGPATAEAILTHREDNGPFRTVDDLLAVRGIGPAKLEALRDLVTVG
jgi:competence protein ComEA